MARAVRLTDYAGALVTALRLEASATLNAIGLPSRLAPIGDIPDRLAHSPVDFRSPDPVRGAAIADGRFPLAGDILAVDEPAGVWLATAPNRPFARALHAFGWLRDCLGNPDDEIDGPALARLLVDGWIAEYGRWNSFAWAHGILSSRVLNWLRNGDLLFDPAVEKAKARHVRMRALLRQAYFLQRALPTAPDGIIRLRCATALALTGLSVAGHDGLTRSGLTALAREAKRQILPDGGHVSRSPRACAEALADLLTVQAAAAAAEEGMPDEIDKAIDRLGPMVRFLRMADGGLASFHGGGEGHPAALDAMQATLRKDIKPFFYAPHSGYHRASAGGATILVDVGEPARGALGTEAHAGTLAFEMCTPGGRLVVNCGWQDDQPSSWREAVRATAAHSTLTLAETSSARLFAPGWRRNLLGPRLASSPAPVTARRNEEELGVWLEGVHEGYRDQWGLSHRRRIFLSKDGQDLRGEDSLFRPVSDGAPEDSEARHPFAIRFHLHPEVRASLARDNMSAILVQPDGSGWRFRTDGGPVRLERSVYLAAGAPPQRATQIVIEGEAEPFGAGDRPPNRVRWAFQQLGQIGGVEGDIA
ncbi:heparinase II/III family protein [Maricaulis sp. CAU 1757]